MADSRSHLASCAARSALRAIGVDEQRDLAGQLHDAAHLVADRAELRLERHGIERRKARGQRLLAILRLEERGVGQARAHDALVAGAHLGRIAALDVAHGDEVRQQLSVARLPPGSNADAPAAWRSALRAAVRGSALRSRRRRRSGHSTSAVTSSSSASSINAWPPQLSRRRRRPFANHARRAAKSAITCPARAASASVVAGVRERERLRGRHEAMSARGARRRRCRECARARARRRTACTSQCTGRTNSASDDTPAHALRDRQRVERALHDGRQQADGS